MFVAQLINLLATKNPKTIIRICSSAVMFLEPDNFPESILKLSHPGSNPNQSLSSCKSAITQPLTPTRRLHLTQACIPLLSG